MALTAEHARITMDIVTGRSDPWTLAIEYGITSTAIESRVKYTLICMGFPIPRWNANHRNPISLPDAIKLARRDPVRLATGLRCKLNPMFDHGDPDTPCGFYYNELLKR